MVSVKAGFSLPFSLLYLNDLLIGLRDLHVGCHWDGLFVGAVAYADDVALLAPSASALRVMLQFCESFAESHGLSFNAANLLLLWILSVHC